MPYKWQLSDRCRNEITKDINDLYSFFAYEKIRTATDKRINTKEKRLWLQ